MKYTFDKEELHHLLSGRFKYTTCVDCEGLGYVWYNKYTGEVGPYLDGDKEDMATDACEMCDGLGGSLKIGATQ
jgi:hypothetical protein